MENTKRFGMLGILIVALLIAMAALAACGSSAAAAKEPAGPLTFDNFEISALQARGADTGIADGAAYFSHAKTTLESGTYEILLSRQRALDVRPYEYLEFEIMTDNLDLFDDIGGFFPRLRTGETYVQFNNSKALQSALAAAQPNEWVKVTAQITSVTFHEHGEEYRTVVPRVDSLLLRFICADMENYDGKIYLRNFIFN